MSYTKCVDCEIETLPTDWSGLAEWYVVHDEIWTDLAGMDESGGCLCIGCLEARIRRPLTAEDFTTAPINDLDWFDLPRFAWTYRTPRLISRLTDYQEQAHA